MLPTGAPPRTVQDRKRQASELADAATEELGGRTLGEAFRYIRVIGRSDATPEEVQANLRALQEVALLAEARKLHRLVQEYRS